MKKIWVTFHTILWKLSWRFSHKINFLQNKVIWSQTEKGTFLKFLHFLELEKTWIFQILDFLILEVFLICIQIDWGLANRNQLPALIFEYNFFPSSSNFRGIFNWSFFDIGVVVLWGTCLQGVKFPNYLAIYHC